jgi:hypothetical protein
MRLRVILLLGIGLLGSSRVLTASPDPPLRAGEQLKYRVSWAFLGAGEIRVAADADAKAPGQLKITTDTSTRGFARLALPFDATADSIYDIKTGRLTSLHERTNTRGKHAEHIVTFDYPAHRAVYAVMGATLPRILPMPAGSPSDLITALLETRMWNLKPDDARDVLVLFNDEFYELTIHALRYEDITTSMGTFHCLLLEPRMEKTPPKGMFRKGSTVHVWIAQDDHKLPVRFEVEFSFGTGVASLSEYRPPTDEK